MAFVYFLKDSHRGFKIGYTKKEPEERLKALQTGNPHLRIYKTLELEETHAKYVERWLQKYHLHNKITGSSGTEFVKIDETTLEESIKKAMEFSKQLFDSEKEIEELLDIQKTTGNTLEPKDEDRQTITALNVIEGKLYLLNEEKTLLQNKLKKRIMDSEGINEIASWTFASRTTLDSKKLQSEKPEIFEAYAKLTQVRTLRIK